MKKTSLLMIISLCLLAACTKDSTSDKTADFSKSTSSLENAVTSGGPAYESFLKNLSDKEASSIGKAVQYFEKEYAKEPSNACDAAWENFDKFVDKVVENINDSPTFEKYKSNPEMVKKLFSPKEGANMNFDAYTKELFVNGISFRISEGDLYAKKDMQYQCEHFEAKVSPEMRTFLRELTKEDKRVMIEDVGLMIPLQEVGERAIFWDQFAQQYPTFKMQKMCENRFRSYLHTLVTEYLDNSPLFDLKTKTLLPNAKETYLKIMEKSPNTRTGKAIAEFYAVLKQNNFQKNAAVEAKMEEIEMKKYPFLR